MELINYDGIVNAAITCRKKGIVAVAGAADLHVIKAVLEAKKKKIAEPILIGERTTNCSCLRQLGENPADFNLVEPLNGETAAQVAVRLIKDGSADVLMKGMIETSDLLRPVVRDPDLKTGRAMSHISFNLLPGYHKIIANTDGGITPHPDIKVKRDIVFNAIDAFHRLGYEMPKVACLCCKETVDAKMSETVEARAMRELCARGEFGSAYVEGPISYDIAMSSDIAMRKGFDCPHCGDFDILVTPDIHSCNIMGKVWTVSMHSVMAGVVLGAAVPIVLSSRGASAEEKFLSLAMALALKN